MQNVNIFTGHADSYLKGRQGYSDKVYDLLFNDILKPFHQIADIGSGTGIFAKIVIEHGYDVFCVEPNEDMRSKAIAHFSANPHFISVASSAESTTLPDDSVNLVTAASAFHWFDASKFQIECKRILKPGGIFFAVANARDYTDPFTLRQHEICMQLCPNFVSLRHGLDKSVPKLKMMFQKDIHHAEFDFPLVYEKEKFIQRSLSSSYAPEPGTKASEKYVELLWELMDEFYPNDNKIKIPNVSAAYWGKLS